MQLLRSSSCSELEVDVVGRQVGGRRKGLGWASTSVLPRPLQRAAGSRLGAPAVVLIRVVAAVAPALGRLSGLGRVGHVLVVVAQRRPPAGCEEGGEDRLAHGDGDGDDGAVRDRDRLGALRHGAAGRRKGVGCT